MKRLLRTRQKLGKYRIEGLLARGGFAEVYRAVDTIEGMRVALKIPFSHLVDKELISSFRKEVRITAKLDHPNVLPIKNAAFIDDHFVVASPLGERTLASRLKSRMSARLALELAEQMIEALAVAHRHKI
ncbi:MAG: protein kinase, partial [Planctomycetes bacterium]|nr:protein kinase [Planctomycetota bacterium]